MLVPAAMNIEAALDAMKTVKPFWIQDQIKELRSALPDANNDIEKGYLLGLYTARVMIRGNVAIGLAGIDLENVL